MANAKTEKTATPTGDIAEIVASSKNVVAELQGRLVKLQGNLTLENAKKVGPLQSDLLAAQRISDRLAKGYY